MYHIALVEDNPDNRLLVSIILEDMCDITEYDCGPVALAGLASWRPDLILLDISLPGMDGPTVLTHIKADPRLEDVPVIALTAHALRNDRQKYLAMGFDDYVTKPIVDETVLRRSIERLIASATGG